mmetsp:Transcript_96020/g.151232  ORF Transcript_96020/g.151232 Transcript_96020/m.151232 type:complete len:179 (+) Transcript_96020:44-580(+)
MGNVLKVTTFWLCVLWCPIIGVALLTVIANQIAIAGVIIPFILLVLLGISTCIAVALSDLVEDEPGMKGGGGIVGQMAKASTTSIRPSSQGIRQGLQSSSQESQFIDVEAPEVVGRWSRISADADRVSTGSTNAVPDIPRFAISRPISAQRLNIQNRFSGLPLPPNSERVGLTQAPKE